ncbi:TetR/AcrR family transcriptional regulator [Amycolatopsis suaedae]|uniref:TetR/AcrR family transcriptional regulator n=1 Tax=Amycolatopsis suaedae TaxID=2510978 RepID=A0A4Q7J9L1_9PSEU|nr:TetR/AcrR family transcriptional regulator [Amycolatopsis suaedae]RZQ63698.1 TetR/AcrR family transcriptional regulator [Amycolatopsis suaedae]
MGHREDLLAAARRLLEEKGYARITARDLVAASGTNLASIGYHFGSKEGLLNAVIGEVFEEWTDRIAGLAMADPAATPARRAEITWSAVLADLDRMRDTLLSYVEALAQAERVPALREQFATHYRRARTRVSRLVARTLGIEPDEPRCVALASFIIAACDGLSVQWLVDPEGAPTAEEMIAALRLFWSASMGTRRETV